MVWRRLWALVLKDVRLFAVDRQAVVMSFVVPVLIASILSWLDSSASSDSPTQRIPILIVDEDNSAASKAVTDGLQSGSVVSVRQVGIDEAKDLVRDGSAPGAAVFPKGFGTQAAGALLGGKKPVVTFITDPAKPSESQIIRGAVIEQAATAVAKQSFGALAAGGPPFDTKVEYGAATQKKWSSAAHDYAGFGIQGLLFFAMEAAVGLSKERRLGIWKRLGAAPISPGLILLSRGVSSALLALAILLTMFLLGGILFGIRILGSYIGFAEVAVAISLMAAAFGLLVATVGKTETQSRALSILLILVMLATGGAWFPMQKMPAWVQSTANWLPVRWAVEGLDAVTWRGEGMAASRFAGVLLLFAAAFSLAALFRFRSVRSSMA